MLSYRRTPADRAVCIDPHSNIVESTLILMFTVSLLVFCTSWSPCNFYYAIVFTCMNLNVSRVVPGYVVCIFLIEMDSDHEMYIYLYINTTLTLEHNNIERNPPTDTKCPQLSPSIPQWAHRLRFDNKINANTCVIIRMSRKSIFSTTGYPWPQSQLHFDYKKRLRMGELIVSTR